MHPVDQCHLLVERLCEDDELIAVVTPAIEGWRGRCRDEQGWRAYRHDVGDYMHRVILQSPAGTLRLHRILRDDASDPHDHPWDFTSRILRGTYVETRPGDPTEHRFGPASVNAKQAEDLHRLRVVDGPVWTFVESGPVRRDWGFATDQGWVHWRRYTALEETR